MLDRKKTRGEWNKNNSGEIREGIKKLEEEQQRREMEEQKDSLIALFLRSTSLPPFAILPSDPLTVNSVFSLVFYRCAIRK